MIVSLENITKKFNEIPVVSQLNMSLQPGQIIGLLGPNGAGKTTTLRMILDIIQPDEGEIKFDEEKIKRDVRNRIGYLPEERGIYQRYKVSDILIYFGRLKNLSKSMSHVEAIRLLDRFNMIDYVHKRVDELSKGMLQILQFIVSIIHNPDVLIFDEPFWGLDPFNQQMVRDYLFLLKDEGKTILLSTHQLEEAENLCDKFVLIDHGKVLSEGTLEALRKDMHDKVLIIEAEKELNLLRNIHNIDRITIKNSKAFLEINEKADVNKILAEIIQTIEVTRIKVNRPSLRDIFLKTIQDK
jgi:ABC-2 type transport system ATP-binding protein